MTQLYEHGVWGRENDCLKQYAQRNDVLSIAILAHNSYIFIVEINFTIQFTDSLLQFFTLMDSS